MANIDPYAEYAFTLHRTVDVSTHKAYFDIRSSYLCQTFETTIGQVEGVSWTAKPFTSAYMILSSDVLPNGRF